MRPSHTAKPSRRSSASPSLWGNSQEEVAGVFFSDPDGNRWAVQALPARE
jgi:hypothetical protein